MTKTHWRGEIDSNSEVFTSADLFEIGAGKDVTFQIAGTKRGELKNPELGKSKRTIMVSLVGVAKPWGLNVTNAKMLERITGSPYRDDWTGARVTLYVTTVKSHGEEVTCIRVRPSKPSASAPVYGGATAAPAAFDLDGWLAALADCATAADLTKLRADLTAAKPPKEHRAALSSAVETAEARVGK